MMPGCPTDILDVARPDAALRGGDPQMRRFHLPGEKRFERRHTGSDQQQTRIIVRNQGVAGQDQMVLAREILQKFLSQFISGHALTSIVLKGAFSVNYT